MREGREPSVTRRSWLRSTWWLHPLLLAAFPVVFLFAINVEQQVSLDPLIAPLMIALGGASVLLLFATVIARVLRLERARAGLVASIGLVLFFSYGHVWQVVEESIRLHRYLLLTWALLAAVGITVALRARIERVARITEVLNLAAIILVIVNLVPIVGFGLRDGGIGDGPPGSGASTYDEADPDIWYLVFDRYGGDRGLRDAFGFDNHPFLATLEERGFTVVDNATANYLKTAHSLASTLEMSYLDMEAYRADATAPDDWTPLYRALQGDHAVGRFLHARGYEYIHLGVRRGATYANSAADRTFLFGDQTEFDVTLQETTMLVALENVIEPEGLGGIAAMYRDHSLYQLEILEQLSSAPSRRPRFILAHFLLPHPPYVFNADGSWVTPAQAAEHTPDEQYLAQLQFTNDRILQLVDAIRGSADEPPVIVLQSDEGPFPDRYARDEDSFAWVDATDAELIEKFTILAAYHVPVESPRELGIRPGMTPVNTFRTVFNAVFDARLDVLPDRNFVFVDQRHIYDMVDVTPRVEALLRGP